MLKKLTMSVAADACAIALAATPAFAAGSGTNNTSQPGNTMNSGSFMGKSPTNPAGQQASNSAMGSSNHAPGANGSGTTTTGASTAGSGVTGTGSSASGSGSGAK
jgi:hypothetical protein